MVTDSIDSAGRTGGSIGYANDGSVGAITGISTVASPAESAKSGYVAQLAEPIGLQLAAPLTTVNESSSIQLSGSVLLDDQSTYDLPATFITWGILSGPLSIDANGRALAGTVYQSTAATVLGSYATFTATLNLTVLNVNTDDYGTYAGDGIDDAWQVRYFGLPPNANAGPNVDFDRTGQTNLFKYIAGLDPLDNTSIFTLTIASVPGQPGQRNLIFTPIVIGRTYTVKFSPDLNVPWVTLTGTTQSDTGARRIVTDLGATQDQKFYHVEITKP